METGQRGVSVSDFIPPMTDPMGKYWRQPSLDEIVIDRTHAVMTQDTLQELADYSASLPSAVYQGKMWRRRCGASWYLCWYGEISGGQILIHTREVLIT